MRAKAPRAELEARVAISVFVVAAVAVDWVLEVVVNWAPTLQPVVPGEEPAGKNPFLKEPVCLSCHY